MCQLTMVGRDTKHTGLGRNPYLLYMTSLFKINEISCSGAADFTYFRKGCSFCTSFSQMHFPNTKTDYAYVAGRLLTMVLTATPAPPPPASIGSFALLQHAHGEPDGRDCSP